MSKRRLEIDAQVKKLLASCKTEEEKIHRFLRIAQQYLYIEEHCEAEKYLLRYLKAKPESHEAHKLVGELYLKLRRYQDAYDSLTRSYRLNESKDVLANICQAAPHASIALTTKQEWLKKAEVANVSQSSLLSLKEAVLREGDSSVQELEDVLKEQSALHPLSPEAQIKLLVFYAEANRFEECVKVILRVEDKQELRNSPQWYRECQDALNKIRASKSIPYDQTLALLHLHISQRLTLGLITDPFFNVDKDKGSVGLEPFFKQLEIFDNLLNEALSNEQWYREGLWSFVLDHFIGQLFFLFALSMLRRADESNQEDTYKARGQALMFCALQYKPKKLGDSWFTKLDEDYKKLLTQIHFDGCYRTTSCYFCLANTSTDAEFPERVKIAVSGNAAIKFVTERLIQGKAIAAVYNQNVLSKACTKLPDRSSIAAYESKSCVAFAWSLEHIVWFLLNGAEMPTEKIFSLLPMVPNMIDAAHTPSQSDIDAFLSAVVAAVKVFGSKAIIKPLVPREIVHRVFTTTKQQNIWDALYRAFVKKATVGRDLITPKKIINDGLEIVRGRDAKKSMPVYYLVRIARDLRDKGHKKPPYFGAAVNYFKIVLARLDEHQTSQPSIGGGRASTSSLFELPKTMAACEDVGGYRDEARLEIGKFMLHCGELENARAILELIHNPMGYLYYAKTAKKLCEKFFAEGDIETGECILEKAKTLLNKGLRMARAEPDVSEKLKAELVSLEQTASDTAATFGMTLNSSGTSQPDTTSLKEIDMAKFETLLRDQTAKIETELAEMKAMQTKFVDTLAQMLAEQKLICSQAKAAALTNSETLAQMLAEQKLICSQAKAAALTNSDMMVKLTQLSQQLTRVEEQINIPQATTDYVDYQETSSTRTQQYQSGGLIIPPGAGLPQFNLTMVQHPSAQTPLVAGASGRTLSSTPTAKDEAPSCKIRFESHGVVYEKPLNRDVPFVAICPDLCQICVFEAPNGNTPFRCLCAVNASSQIVVNHDLNRVTFQTFETRDGQVNVQWTAGDKCYYIEFADWTIQPGEILMKALQACGLPVLPAAHAAEPSPVKENIFLASALSKSPLKDPAVEALSRIGRADENSKSSFFSTPFATPAATLPTFTGVAPTSSTGILPTPVAPTAPPPSTTSASPFSFSFNKPNVFTSSGNTNTGGLSNPPVSTFGGFTFSTTPVTAPLKTSPSSDNVKTPEKPKTDAPNPFSGFSFGLTKSEDQKPALGGWPTTTTAPLTSITAKTTFSFSAPTTAVPTIASSPSGQKDVAANDEQGAADAEGEDYECTAQFRPVIELPQLVETKTGEEGEDVKFCERAKLYRYDTETHEWKERGLGEMKILRNQTTGKYRVLMRREQVLKICANHQIIPGLKLMPRKKPTEYTWAAPDFADGEQKNEQFVVRFKTKEQAEKFREVFEEGLVSAQSMSPVKPQASKAEAPSTTTESKPLPSLSELFKPAAGSWSCGGCYVDNKSDAATCIACGTPNPSKATQPSGGGASSGAAAVSSPFKFGIQAAVKEEKKEEKLPSLADSFKSAPNSWNCTICYASNSPSSDKCSACQTVKPGKTPTGPFKFGLSTPSVFGSSDGDLSGKSQVSKAPISTTFTFGTTPATSVAAQPATGFVFGQTVNTSPNAAAKTPTKVTFAAQPTTIPELSPDFTFGFPQQHEFSFEKRQSDDEDDQVVESQDRDFAPAVASLPPEIEVVTGEEGQEVLYCQRAKLFRFVNKEWKERGLGDFKILRDPNTLKIRLTMRREKVHKVCLNHYLTKDIEFNMLKNDRSIKWQALDFSEGEIEPTLFAIRVRTVEIACEMLDAILSAQKGVCGTPVNCSTPKVEQPMSAVKPRVLFEETVDAGESSAVSSSDSVEIIKVEKACEADVRRARELMLPDHFFLYESRKHQCKGCRGCESDTTEEDSPVTAEKSSVVAKKSPVVAEKSPVTAEKSPVVAEKSPVTAKNEAAVKPKKVSQTKSPQSTEKVAPTSVDESVVTPVKLEQQTKTPPKAAPVFGAPPAFGTVPVEQTRNENLKPLEASSTTADSGFVFGAGSTMSFSALAASSASSGFAKPKGENPWSNSSQPTSFFSAFSKTGAGSNTTSQSDDTTQAEDTDEVEPSKDIHFEPVIPMPELITVQTGEEQDEVLYSQRAKLYVFHAQTSEWKERAIGDAKILRCSDGRARIVVRRDTVHKVACNHYITDSMELKPLATATNSVTWSAVDFAENDPTPQLFALKVKTEARLNDFKKIFEEEVERARKAKEGEHLEQKQKPSDVGEDLEDFEIVKCSPDGVVTTRTEASEERGGEDNEYVYEKDEDEEAGDEDAGDEDSDTYYDDDDVLFTALVNFSEEVPIGENQWTNLGPGILRVVYDDEVFGHVIHLSDQETDTEFAETIIALQTSLRETGRKGIWMAVDTKQKPSVRRRFCAEFSSDEDLKSFALVFNEGKETAVQTGIVENCDQPPWMRSEAKP